MKLPDYCKILETPNAKFDVYFLHGYKSKKSHQMLMAKKIHDWGYTTILCDARGHGKRKNIGTREDWAESLEDINKIITERKKASILIGHSMGGTHAITLGVKNPLVKQVFAIAAGHGKDVLDNPERVKSFIEQHNVRDISKQEALKMVKTLPFLYESCKSENNKKFFLIHAKNDKIVPFSDFEANKSQLCLPDENVLIYDHVREIGNLPHIWPFYDKKTLNFIEEKMRK